MSARDRTTALRVAVLCIRLARLCEDKDPRKASEFYAGAWEQFQIRFGIEGVA